MIFNFLSQGAENCLAGVSFLITGVLDSLERDEAENLIQKYGGRTVNSVSSKLNYIIVGDEAGPAKLTKVCFYMVIHIHTYILYIHIFYILFVSVYMK